MIVLQCVLSKKKIFTPKHTWVNITRPLSIYLDSKLSRHPLWRGGRNHLLFNLYAGTWPEYREHELALENRQRALLVKASASEGKHRRGFDISFPLIHASHASKGGGKSLSISLSLSVSPSLSPHTPLHLHRDHGYTPIWHLAQALSSSLQGQALFNRYWFGDS